MVVKKARDEKLVTLGAIVSLVLSVVLFFVYLVGAYVLPDNDMGYMIVSLLFIVYGMFLIVTLSFSIAQIVMSKERKWIGIVLLVATVLLGFMTLGLLVIGIVAVALGL